MVLFNFILGSGKAYATETVLDDNIGEEAFPPDQQKQLIEQGDTPSVFGGVMKFAWNALGGNFSGMLAGILAQVVNVFPRLIQLVMQVVVYEKDKGIIYFTIERAVFNEFKVFSINYFDFSDEDTTDLTKTMRETVAKFYIILRLIAITLSLVVLIYVGIRMALSAAASDKAKYKKMLIGWVESIILLFVMQYIMALIFNLGEVFTDMLNSMRTTLQAAGQSSFEESTLDKINSFLFLTNGWNYAFYSVVFWFLVYIQTKFFVMYFRRVIVVGFLILISPLVTITYPLDKLGDSKAQAFSVWLFEFMMNVFIQPIQALIYLIMMFTAGEIAKYSTLVALLFLLSLTKVEKIVLHLFNLRNVASLRPVDEERKKKV